MTLRIIEGFDWFPAGVSSAVERERLWAAKGYYYGYTPGATVRVPNVTTGRFGFGYAWTSGSTAADDGLKTHTIPAKVAVTSGFAGVTAFRGSIALNSWSHLTFFDGAYGQAQFTVSLHQYGTIVVTRGGPAGTELVRSSMGVFQDDEWFFLEVGGVIHASSGSVEVRVNTKTVISLVSANTKGSTGSGNMDSVQIGWYLPGSSAVNFSFDDLYFCDSAGSANNTFLGNARVKSQLSVADGGHIAMTIGGSSPAATNWQSVLNNALDDTEYVYSGTAGVYDLYSIQPILNAPVVLGIQVSSVMRQDDATQRVGHNVINVGGTQVEGSDHYTNQTFTFYGDIWEINPHTSVGFTGSEVNGMTIGPKVQV